MSEDLKTYQKLLEFLDKEGIELIIKDPINMDISGKKITFTINQSDPKKG